MLANALNNIHSEFEIREKIQRTTDKGSNFIKVFGEDENSNEVKSRSEEHTSELQSR